MRMTLIPWLKRFAKVETALEFGYRVGALLVLVVALVASGCLIIPYRPPAVTQHEETGATPDEFLRITATPAKHLEKIAKAVLNKNPRLQRIDGKSYLEKVWPGTDLTLSRLLSPTNPPPLAPLSADYLVILGAPSKTILKQQGDMGVYIGFAGAKRTKGSTSYRAWVVDLRELRLMDQFTAESTGNDVGVGLFYGLFIVSDTNGSARKELVRQLGAQLEQLRPTGSVRVVFLSDGTVPQ